MRNTPFSDQDKAALRARGFTISGDGTVASFDGSASFTLVRPGNWDGRLLLSVGLSSGDGFIAVVDQLLDAIGIELNETV